MESLNSSKHYDVVVVGAGVIGSALACSLASQCPFIKVALLEARPELKTFDDQFDPRVYALSASTIRFLKSVDVWPEVLAQRACVYQNMHVWDASSLGEVAFSCDDIHSDYLGYIIENAVLLKALRNRLDSCSNVDFIAPVHLQSMDRRNLWQIELDGEDGTSSISAELLVGADGAHSKVRELSGFKTREWDYGQRAIVCTVQTELPHQHTAWQRFTADGPLAFLPLPDQGDKHFCSIVWSLNEPLGESYQAMSDEAFCRKLGAEFEHTLGNILAADQRFLIPLRQRHATDYIAEGLALVGDAAHTIHPLAGQGANLGFYDVQSLSDILVKASQQKVSLAHPLLLKRYQRQRKIHNLSAMATMEGIKRLFDNKHHFWVTARSTGMNWVNNTGWLKQQLIKVAAGENLTA